MNCKETVKNHLEWYTFQCESGTLFNAYIQLGKKVLVVCNTVKSAQKVFGAIQNTVDGRRPLLLHGSFSGVDRAKKEKLLSLGGVDLLIGTQAIEVSLDIDYDLIYSEPAPIDALVQRFGRVNRKGEKGICPCFVFLENNEDDFYIYDKFTIEKTIEVLKGVISDSNGILDESLLQYLIDQVYPNWSESDKDAFERQYVFLTEALGLLSPMFKNKYTEEDFYKQFDGIKVLPQANRAAYERSLQDLDIIKAESQKVSIRRGRFMKWKAEGYLKKDILMFEKDGDVRQDIFWTTNKKYDSDLGLVSDEVESWKTGEIL